MAPYLLPQSVRRRDLQFVLIWNVSADLPDAPLWRHGKQLMNTSIFYYKIPSFAICFTGKDVFVL